MKSLKGLLAAGRVVRVAIVILVLVACSPIEAAAQVAPTPPPPAAKRWSVSLGRAVRRAGPTRQFEDAMRSAHFDDQSVGWSAGQQIGHPSSSGGGISPEYDVTYRRNDRLAFGVVMSRAQLGSTSGYQDPWLYLSLRTRVTLLAPVAYMRLGTHALVGAGPLVAWTEVRDDPSLSAAAEFRSATGGAIAVATWEGSPTRYTYLAVTASYRWIAPVTVGPFTATTVYPSTSATLPAMRVNLSHASIGVNLGMRF